MLGAIIHFLGEQRQRLEATVSRCEAKAEAMEAEGQTDAALWQQTEASKTAEQVKEMGWWIKHLEILKGMKS